MNELIFFIHGLFVVGCSLGALYLGKEALICLISLFTLLSNIFVTKQIILFGLNATPTDAFTIGIVISFNLLQEFFGKEIVKKTITINCIISIIYMALSQLYLFYIPTASDTIHTHAHILFSITPRIIIASLSTYYIVQQIDCVIYTTLKKYFTSYLVARNFCTLVISQLIDTILFSFLGLYGIVESIVPIICISYLIKLLVIGITTPFIYFSKKITYVQNYEQISI